MTPFDGQGKYVPPGPHRWPQEAVGFHSLEWYLAEAKPMLDTIERSALGLPTWDASRLRAAAHDFLQEWSALAAYAAGGERWWTGVALDMLSRSSSRRCRSRWMGIHPQRHETRQQGSGGSFSSRWTRPRQRGKTVHFQWLAERVRERMTTKPRTPACRTARRSA